jgi:hypothetical protein
VLRQYAETARKSRFSLRIQRFASPSQGRPVGRIDAAPPLSPGIGGTPNRSQGAIPDMSVVIETHKCMGEADDVAS